MEYFFHDQQGKQGPFSKDQMADFLRNGRLNPASFIWREGLDGWVKIGETGDFDAPSPPSNAPPGDSPEAIFNGILKKSWKIFQKHNQVTQIDEVLVGAVITSTLDNGYSLIDLTSDGTFHYLRFEDVNNGNRIIFQLRHLAGELVTAEVIGHEASVTIGYGERHKSFKKVWNALKQEMKGGYISKADPGIITVDGDISSQYVYVEVGMLWDINDYLHEKGGYEVNYPKLTQHIASVIHVLRKYLHTRIGQEGLS